MELDKVTLFEIVNARQTPWTPKSSQSSSGRNSLQNEEFEEVVTKNIDESDEDFEFIA